MRSRSLLLLVGVALALAGCTTSRPASPVDADLQLHAEPRVPFVSRTSNTIDVGLANDGPSAVRIDPPALGYQDDPGSVFLRIAWDGGIAYVPEAAQDAILGGVQEQDHAGCADLVTLAPDASQEWEISVGGFEPGAFRWEAGREYDVTVFYTTTCSQATWRDVLSNDTTVVPQPYDDG